MYWNFVLFVCFKGIDVGMPTLPDESNPYLQRSPSVGTAKLPWEEEHPLPEGGIKGFIHGTKQFN